MSVIVKPRRSNTPSNVPTGLQDGEFAINVPDKLIYIGNSTGGSEIVGNYALPGSVSITETEIDIGSQMFYENVVSVPDEFVTPSSKIMVTQSGKAAGGQYADENELMTLSFAAVPETGQFKLFIKSLNGPASGKFLINYIVG